MKVLFVTKEKGLFEDMAVMYLSAILRKSKHTVDIVKLNVDSMEKKIKLYNPDIVAYSIFTGEHLNVIEINRQLKRKYSFISVFGGPHATFSPEIIQEEGVDFVCIGEGEFAFLELAERLEKKRSILKIKNFWVKNRGKIIKNETRPLIDDLDKLPFPDRTILYDNFESLKENETKYFMMGRGCPYACSYCFNHIYNKLYKKKGKILRHRTVKSVIQEILDVKSKYPLKFIHFYDDNIIGYEKDWLEEFLNVYKEKIKVPFRCEVRANHVTEDVVRKLKEAGCYSISMGLECGNDTLRNVILKRNMSDEQIINACRLFKEYGIKILLNNLVGLPVHGPIDIDVQTLNMNIECKADFAWSSILYPYPKTDIYKYCEQKGYFNQDSKKFIVGNKIGSCLSFRNKREYNEVVNFHKLFGITTEFPFLLPLIRILIRLPPNTFFNMIFFLWYGYCFEIKLTPFSILNINRDLRLIRNFVSYMHEM